MFLIADHPYLSCTLALCAGFILGWLSSLVTTAIVEETAADDRDHHTGIGA